MQHVICCTSVTVASIILSPRSLFISNQLRSLDLQSIYQKLNVQNTQVTPITLINLNEKLLSEKKIQLKGVKCNDKISLFFLLYINEG